MVGGLDVDVVAVDLDEALTLADADQGAGDRHLQTVGQRAAKRDEVAVVGAFDPGDQPHRHPALGGEQWGVDVGDLLLDDVGEDALERRELEDPDVVLRDLAAHLDVELLGHPPGECGEDAAELLGERDAGTDVLGDHAALDVDGVGDQLAAEGQPHRLRDRDAGLLLGLVGAGAEVRGGDDVLELEERAVGAGLAREDVEARRRRSGPP